MENLTYESAATELETILLQLKADTVNIDDLAKHVERASVLLQFCTDKLKTTELKVNSVIANIGL